MKILFLLIKCERIFLGDNFMLYKERLKSIRENRNLKQKDLANILDISESCYSRYENELDILPSIYLNILCHSLDISIDYLFNLTNKKIYNNIKKDINNILAGKRIKTFRKENGLTQTKLAEILNTVQPVIANYENGKHLIATPFLYAICKKYHVSADYLLGRIDKPKYFDINTEKK